MLSSLDTARIDEGIVEGKITTFTRIDPKGVWFDSTTLEEATEDKTRQVVIPRDIFPNSEVFSYFFDLPRHRLYFQTYSSGDVLTPNSAKRLFEGLAHDLSILKDFGMPAITIIQSRRAVNTLLSLPVLKVVEITILRPNPDILAADFENRIVGQMEEANARKVQLKYEAEPGGSLNRTEDMDVAAGVAADSGNVRVKGRDASGAVDQSTANFPAQMQDKFDPDQEDEQNAFRRIVNERRQG